MYHGVPVVGVPLFGDHYDTMTRVAAKGMGLMLHWKSMTEEELRAALHSVISDSRSAPTHTRTHQCMLVD
jgi:2-hydroxyacylsphingosine 1-beta-galactosyltransferase